MKRRDSASAIAVVWSDQAGRDLDAIADFIALDDPVVAVQWVERLVDAAERLTRGSRVGAGPSSPLTAPSGTGPHLWSGGRRGTHISWPAPKYVSTDSGWMTT